MKIRPDRVRITAEDALTVDMRGEFARAAAGDTAAIQEALRFIHESFRFNHPLPEYAKAYLLPALDAGSKGRSLDEALGLKRRGARNTWTTFDKRLAAFVVQQFVVAGETLDVAAESAAAVVKKASAAALMKPSAWSGYRGRAPSEATIRKWYHECNPAVT